MNTGNNMICPVFLGAVLWVLSGCVTMPSDNSTPTESTGVTAYESDGYYEPLPPLGKKGYFVQKLAPEVYFFSTGVYNNLFVVTSEGVVITDPIRGKGRLLKTAIREVTDRPVRFMIYSHAHMDHIGDAHLFAGEEVQIIAQLETGKMLRRYKDPDRPVPHINFGMNYTLSIGGVTIDLIYPGEGHGKGNSIIYIPSHRIMMYVDTVTPKSVPFKNFAYTTDIFSQVRAIKKALKLDFDVYIAGHLHRPGTREEMEEVLEYYYASKEASKVALKKVSFLDIRRRSKTRVEKPINGVRGVHPWPLRYLELVSSHAQGALRHEAKVNAGSLPGRALFLRGRREILLQYT